MAWREHRYSLEGAVSQVAVRRKVEGTLVGEKWQHHGRSGRATEANEEASRNDRNCKVGTPDNLEGWKWQGRWEEVVAVVRTSENGVRKQRQGQSKPSCQRKRERNSQNQRGSRQSEVFEIWAEVNQHKQV